MQGDCLMKLKKSLSIGMILLLILSLLTLNFSFMLQPMDPLNNDTKITIVSQGSYVDLHITPEDIEISQKSALVGDEIKIYSHVSNLGTVDADFNAMLYLEDDGNRTQLEIKNNIHILENRTEWLNFTWQVPQSIDQGEYLLGISLSNIFVTDNNDDDNDANKSIVIRSGQQESVLEIEPKRDWGYPDGRIWVIATLINNEPQKVNANVQLFLYNETQDVSEATHLMNLTIEADPQSEVSTEFLLYIPKVDTGKYIILSRISDPETFRYVESNVTFKLLERPDTSKTPVYLELWFIIGLIALIIFFLTIIFSLIGVIPQDRLPIQPALVVMALVIMILALIGNYLDPQVHLIGAQDIAGMVIIHPITALTAGFLVAGGLEAAGAFAAAADALGRIEKLKFKGKTIFGFTGTVVILTNIPTLIAMPCGRILGAALMPAALFFGYRVAKAMGDARMVGVVVFPFIVNAAASCGPSPLGGIGTIGEGLSKMPIGSFTTAQSTGIMIATGVCALFMRYITFMRPADLSDEDIRREMEANKQAIKNDLAKDKAEANINPGKNVDKTNVKNMTNIKNSKLKSNPQNSDNEKT